MSWPDVVFPRATPPPWLAEGVPHSEYHADAFFDGPPALSRSVACRLLNESPLHAWASHPRLGGCAKADDTAASDMGSLIHGLLLGEAAEVAICTIPARDSKGKLREASPAYGLEAALRASLLTPEMIPARDWKTQDAQQFKEKARLEGKLPVLLHDYTAAMAIVDPLRNQLDEVTEGAFSEAAKEVTALWESGGVLCKARMDALHLGRGLIIDLKFLANAHPVAFGRSMVRYGYDLQRASYLEAVGTCHPELAGRMDFQFLLIEVDPHSKVPVRLGDRFVISSPVLAGSKKGLGEARWSRAKALWKRCLDSGSWPAYEAAPIEAAPWELTEELNAGLAAGGDPSWMGD